MNIGKGIIIKELKKMIQKQKSDASVVFNQQFLNKTLKEIFSENISKRYTNFPPDHNKNVINKLINEDNDEIRAYFIKLFNLTFIQCLRYYRGSENILELEGLNKIDTLKIKYGNDEDYYKLLIYYFSNYEQITNNKRMRGRNKEKKK